MFPFLRFSVKQRQIHSIFEKKHYQQDYLSAAICAKFSTESKQKIALLSVTDKTGLAEFASELVKKHGYKILSTGGTAKMLAEKGIPVTEVSEHTGFPEIMGGRVKSLHPKIHGGLLARRDKPEHLAQAKSHNIDLIDLVVVNLYSFEGTVAKPGVTFEQAVENIDIGGPSMLRSAAKNMDSVTVVCDPIDYNRVLSALNTSPPEELKRLRRELATKVFSVTSQFDQAVLSYLSKQTGASSSSQPDAFSVSLQKAQDLRYGENPHQSATLYKTGSGDFLSAFKQLQGKELSYNNIIDITAARQLIDEFGTSSRPTIAILKHTNPCGVASAPTLAQAWDLAFETDKQAPFGGIIVANTILDGDTAKKVGQLFCEVVIAPEFSEEALAIFAKKKNVRLMKSLPRSSNSDLELRSVYNSGVLVQQQDRHVIDKSKLKVATTRHPTDAEWDGLLFAWKVVKHIKSNAIVYCAAEPNVSYTLGVGAGQMSRVDSSRLALWKAEQAGLSGKLKGCVLASDAFFPFADGLLAAANAGVKAVIQPGGSVRDQEVIDAANKAGVAMVFTEARAFKH